MIKRLAFCVVMLMAASGGVFAGGPADESLASGQEALNRGDKDRALTLADAAVGADPKNPGCYALRASVRDARREFDKAIVDYGTFIQLAPGAVSAYQRRGEDQFRLGHFKESVSDFDKVIEMQPAREPYHWQRGISLYYAGEFDRGAKQFELHKTVNPEDVENAVWDYLCVARVSGVDKARKGLIAIHDDGRVPMMQVYAMFEGKLTPQDVLDAAKAGKPSEAELAQRLCYAHLYIGLFHEAAGDAAAAKEHILLAAAKFSLDDYMGDVARIHATVLGNAGKSK